MSGQQIFRWLMALTIAASLIAIAVPAALTQTQAPEIVWDKTFGGPKVDLAVSVQQTSDGGYILAGSTTVAVNADIDTVNVYVIKTDAHGNELWSKIFGGNKPEYGVSAKQTTDGGYIILGSKTGSSATNTDPWLIKLDANGNRLWDRTFADLTRDKVAEIQQRLDGGYIIVGSKEKGGAYTYDVWLFKTDAQGNLEWERTFGGANSSNSDEGYSVQQTADGGYILGGYTDPGEKSDDAWLIKTDAQGNKVWDKVFLGSGREAWREVRQTSDGGHVAVGRFNGSGAWLMKTDAEGNKLWDKIFFGNSGVGASVKQVSDGGYIIAGGKQSSTGSDGDLWVIKTDPQGN